MSRFHPGTLVVGDESATSKLSSKQPLSLRDVLRVKISRQSHTKSALIDPFSFLVVSSRRDVPPERLYKVRRVLSNWWKLMRDKLFR